MEAIEGCDDEAFAAARRHFDLWEWNRRMGASGYAAPLWPREYGGAPASRSAPCGR